MKNTAVLRSDALHNELTEPAYTRAVLNKLASEHVDQTPHRFADTQSIDPGEALAADLQEKITRRAYELAESRGFVPGHEVEDWLRAEREVLMAPELQVLKTRT